MALGIYGFMLELLFDKTLRRIKVSGFFQYLKISCGYTIFCYAQV